ncbi:hypothetical protein GCM10009665_67190 [Kitasatospora nipponensis]|uniref:GH16 domain-containing protein n=1 Tax=Kitasatospora nipponensis TaxID=258049 RepID=A0ABP4HIZ1_9ACTN
MLNHAKHRRPSTRPHRVKLAVLGVAVAASAVGTTAWAAQAATPAAPAVVVDSLTLSAPSPAAGSQVTATAKVHASRSIALQRLTVAVRDAKGGNYDFPGAIATTLGPAQSTFTPAARTFPAGTYQYFVAYEVGGVWHNLTPATTFTSGAALPTPSPTPTAGPTATASAKPTATASPTAAPKPTATPTPTATASPTAPATPTPTASASATATPTPTPTFTTSPTPTTPATGGPLGMTGSWRPVFADEFNGSSLDTSKWTPNWLGCATCTTQPVSSAESQAYAPSQATVSGGSLHLTAVQKPTTVNGKTYPYTSGMVQSNGKAQFTYGAFESRIYLPASGGKVANWPAFWTDGQSWPNDGEMDVMEGLSGNACYHFHSPSGGPGGCAPGDFTGWHTYGAQWQPGSVTYYYDGKAVGTISTGITSAPQYLILNNAVGGSGGASVAPADMQVDYVRVWQH